MDFGTNWSDSDDSDQPRHFTGRSPIKSRQSQSQPQSHSKHALSSRPGSRARRSISPPPLNRQSGGSFQLDTAPASSSIIARGDDQDSRQPAQKDDVKMGSRQSTTRSANTTPTKQRHQPTPVGSRTPKHNTPRKPAWTVEKLEESLRAFAEEIGKDGAKRTVRLMRLSWKKKAPAPQSVSSKNWFAGMKCTPAEGGKKSADTMKIKTKQVGHGRSGKMERREHYRVICIKTDKEPVPRYSFHHVDIVKNILSPNTMLTYVPHLRDLADNEEKKYRTWLENLESMDKTSGFATLSRHQKVVKTIQKERATILLLYLDRWLSQLGLEACTKSNLIRHMTREMETATPQQKSSILSAHADESGSPRTGKTIKMFTQAFDNVFNAERLKEQRVPLQEVLLLDKSVDTFGDPKKWMKETPGQTKAVVDQSTTVESFTETYSLLGCLICFCHSCEHGEFGVDNERKRFSVEMIGGMSGLLERSAHLNKGNGSRTNLPTELNGTASCGPECTRDSKPGTRARPWTEIEVNVLKAMHATSVNDSIPVECAVAQIISRPCWDVQRQLEKLDLPLPATPKASPMPKPKALPWYDRHKKMLLGDWQDQIMTHEHQRKDCFDPCNHEGSCTPKNCTCVQHGLLCERFCRCTADMCAYKFTGCACHSLGKVCMPKQKDRPCICIQLNRECDPALCGSCGVVERTEPANADNDLLFTTGCQNCALQRGRPKSVILGKSRIAGYGLFAAEDIGQDEFVIEYVGELISQDEGVRREARRGDVFDESANTSYLFTLLEQEGIWVDAAIYGNLSRYINHQDDNCNVTPRILFVNGEYRIKFSSLRDIKAGEELFFNYGENFPNLTKKLLQEEKAHKRQRKAKEQLEGDDDDKPPRKKPGRKPGRKAGRPPSRKPKKTFATLESDPEDDEDVTMEDVTVEGSVESAPAAASRKRKRAGDDGDNNETEYKESSTSTQPVRPKARRGGAGGKRPGPKPRRQIEVQDTADEDTATQSQEEVTILPTAPANPPRERRLRKDDKPPQHKHEEAAENDVVVAEAEEVTVVSSGRKSRSSHARHTSHVEARFVPIHIDLGSVEPGDDDDDAGASAPVDESPTRSRKARRQQQQQQQRNQQQEQVPATDSSPLSELNYQSDSEDVRPSTRNRSSGGGGSAQKRRGRSDVAYSNNTDNRANDDTALGSVSGGSWRTPTSQNSGGRRHHHHRAHPDESEDNGLVMDPVRSRSRTRRKPARYDD